MSVTTEGFPEPITRVWFRARYGQNFPELLSDESDELLDECISSVYEMFYGVKDIWCHLPRPIYVKKTQLCYGLLVAWYITDIYPDYAEGVQSSGAVPLKAKKIGGTQVYFADRDSTSAGASNNADLLSSLKSNAFGMKAYFMIKASGKLNFFIRH